MPTTQSPNNIEHFTFYLAASKSVLFLSFFSYFFCYFFPCATTKCAICSLLLSQTIANPPLLLHFPSELHEYCIAYFWQSFLRSLFCLFCLHHKPFHPNEQTRTENYTATGRMMVLYFFSVLALYNSNTRFPGNSKNPEIIQSTFFLLLTCVCLYTVQAHTSALRFPMHSYDKASG